MAKQGILNLWFNKVEEIFVICGEKFDGKIFKVEDLGCEVNAPTKHPNSHWATAPYLDRKEYDEWLNSYKDHGLTFEEWKKDTPQFKINDKFYEKCLNNCVT